MQQRVEILKMLYRNNDILIFDLTHCSVDTPGNKRAYGNAGFAGEGVNLFITHKLNEIMAVADRCTVLRKEMHWYS